MSEFGFDLPSAYDGDGASPPPPPVSQARPVVQNQTVGKKRPLPVELQNDDYSHAMGADDDDDESKSDDGDNKSDEDEENDDEPTKKKRGRPRKNAPKANAPEPKRRKKSKKDEDEEASDKDIDDEDMTTLMATRKEQREQRQTESLIPDKRISDKERTAKLLAKFTPEQLRRYEAFKRSKFQFSSIKKVMSHAANVPTNQAMQIVMAGITKLYVGDLVENAKLIMHEWGEPPGPIQPKHIKEAYRRIQQKENMQLKFKH
jgi:transcription initiation factor TFIID subunit 11